MYYRQMPSKQPLGVRGKLRMDGIDAIMIQSDYKVLFFEVDWFLPNLNTRQAL